MPVDDQDADDEGFTKELEKGLQAALDIASQPCDELDESTTPKAATSSSCAAQPPASSVKEDGARKRGPGKDKEKPTKPQAKKGKVAASPQDDLQNEKKHILSQLFAKKAGVA